MRDHHPIADKDLAEGLTTGFCRSRGHRPRLLPGRALTALGHGAVLPGQHHDLFGLGGRPVFAPGEGGDEVRPGGAVASVRTLAARAQRAAPGGRRGRQRRQGVGSVVRSCEGLLLDDSVTTVCNGCTHL